MKCTRNNGVSEALMIRRTLRSGQTIHHDGPVVVYGDVNDGAEIVAAGDVLILENCAVSFMPARAATTTRRLVRLR